MADTVHTSFGSNNSHVPSFLTGLVGTGTAVHIHDRLEPDELRARGQVSAAKDISGPGIPRKRRIT
jgi:hypothetical protein